MPAGFSEQKEGPDMQRRLFRSTRDVMISGVCGGIAEFFNIDPSLVRILWVVLSFATGGFLGLIAYIACVILLPKDTDIQ